MTINSYLQDLASDLVLSETEKSNISTSISAIKSYLNSYFGDEITGSFVFGSYDRGTILPRKVDEYSDVDLMVIFKNLYLYKPQTFLNKLKDFAELYYSRSEIHQSSPTIVLELHHIKFELVPAYFSYGGYHIPNGPSYWVSTNPTAFYSQLTTCNSCNSYKIKPIVRLIKHWNISKNYRSLSSYELENKIAESMTNSYLTCTSYAEYAIEALTRIKFLTNQERVTKAIDHLYLSEAYEKNGLQSYALSEIKKVFPEI